MNPLEAAKQHRIDQEKNAIATAEKHRIDSIEAFAQASAKLEEIIVDFAKTGAGLILVWNDQEYVGFQLFGRDAEWMASGDLVYLLVGADESTQIVHDQRDRYQAGAYFTKDYHVINGPIYDPIKFTAEGDSQLPANVKYANDLIKMIEDKNTKDASNA